MDHQALPLPLNPRAEDSDMSEYNDEAEKAVHPPRGKTKGKRRMATADSNSKPAKKLRRSKGILKDFVETPMDILFEIFGHLEPIDLLHLARTSKDLRAILMNKTNKFVWKSSFENVEPPLPECPDDLSEPAYADLAFGKGCYYCGRNIASVQVSWQCRIRFCNGCISDHATYSEGGLPYDFRRLLPVVPVSTSRKRGRHYYNGNIWVDGQRRLVNEYKNLDQEKKQEWCERKSLELQNIQAHSGLCESWALKRAQHSKQSHQQLVDDRKATVLDNLIKMGWGDEIQKIPKGGALPQAQPFVIKACQKPLTDRILTGLRPQLIGFMEACRDGRLAKERREFLNRRLLPLRDAYKTFLATIPACEYFAQPQTVDIMQLRAIQDILYDRNIPDEIRNTSLAFSPSHLESLAATFPGARDAWAAHIAESLTKLIVTAATSWQSKNIVPLKFDPRDALEWPTTFLLCSYCDTQIHASDIATHPCLKTLTSSEEDGFVNANIRERRWTLEKVTFDPGLAVKIGSILESLKLDPATQTLKTLNALDPIIECIQCHDETSGRCTLRWTHLPTHLHQFQPQGSHGLGQMFRLLEEPLASVVRARLNERYDIAIAKHPAKDTAICTTCRMIDNYATLLRHVRTAHSIIRPEAGKHIVLNLCGADAVSQKYRHVFELWPPLAQEDLRHITNNPVNR